jgi:hypothetical protein
VEQFNLSWLLCVTDGAKSVAAFVCETTQHFAQTFRSQLL